MQTRRFRVAVLAVALAGSSAATAQDYPTRPITLIVPFAAGGTSDVIARLAAEGMSRVLGQQIINENTPGAGGTTALTRLARATPDGYTIGIGNSGTNAASYLIHKDVIRYKPDAFVPIGLVAKTLPVVALRKDFPAKDVREFVAYAQANPSKVTLGHAGVGSSNYLICRAFTQAAGIKVTLVSYRGAAPALSDAMGGQIDGVCDAAASVASAIGGGNVRGLVIAAPNRLPSLPDVPTSGEAGLPGFDLQGWNGLFVPKGTPEPVQAKLNEALRQVVASPEFKARMDQVGSLPASGEELAPGYVTTLVPAEIARSEKLLADSGR
jgi:tripartite-type tricarboxylate transporter receptor subunit TctC